MLTSLISNYTRPSPFVCQEIKIKPMGSPAARAQLQGKDLFLHSITCESIHFGTDTDRSLK